MKKVLDTMKKRKVYTIVLVAAFAVVGASYLIFSQAATPPKTATVNVSAGTASFTLSPATAEYAQNKTFTLGIYENSGSDGVSTVDVKIGYDAEKLSFVEINSDGGVFNTCFENSGGAGSASLVCSKLGGSFTGNQKIGNIVFKTKTTAGSAAVNFKSTSHIFEAATPPTELWSGNTNGGVYTVKSAGDPTPTPDPEPNDPTPTPTKPSGGGGSTNNTPSNPSSSGSSSGSGSTGSNDAPSGAATPSTQPVTGSSQGARGESITLKILDKNGAPVAGAKVLLKDVLAVSGSDGVVRYYGVTAGAYTVSVTTPEREIKQKITVKDTNGSKKPQEFTISVKPKSMIIYYLIIAGIAIVALSALYVFFNKLQQKARFRRTHGLDHNKAVVFDPKSNPSSSEASSIDQGPMIKPENQVASVPKVEAAPVVKSAAPEAPKTTPPVAQTPGNLITPNDSSKETPKPADPK